MKIEIGEIIRAIDSQYFKDLTPKFDVRRSNLIQREYNLKKTLAENFARFKKTQARVEFFIDLLFGILLGILLYMVYVHYTSL